MTALIVGGCVALAVKSTEVPTPEPEPFCQTKRVLQYESMDDYHWELVEVCEKEPSPDLDTE